MSLTADEAELLADDLHAGASRLYGRYGEKYRSTFRRSGFVLDEVKNER